MEAKQATMLDEVAMTYVKALPRRSPIETEENKPIRAAKI
jgi:hypothetical protein